MSTQRRLAAIMFTDIVGFSAIMQRDEANATLLRNRHRSVFREMHTQFSGEILQYFGDGTLSIFDSSANAVECAVAMQIEFRKEPEVPLRIGIHSGDIAYDEEGAYGDGLNIASRIERICVPGGVYISAKVYDDIKNHSWLEALSLGHFELRNIQREIEIYAITNSNLPVPEPEELYRRPAYIQTSKIEIAGDEQYHRNKQIAALIALVFGVFGAHRLYLGQITRGIIHMALAIIAMIVTVQEGTPLIAIFGLIGIIDGVLLLAMSKQDFDRKYNYVTVKMSRRERKRAKRTMKKTTGRPLQKETRQARNHYLREGIELYKNGKFEEAIYAFEKSLNLEPGHIAAYFNLACCYSSLRKTQQAFEHLEQAFNYGFSDIKLLQSHPGLSYIRRLDNFQRFIDNDFRYLEQLPPPRKDLLESLTNFNPEVLDRLEDLGSQLENGTLSPEEFEAMKKDILKRE